MSYVAGVVALVLSTPMVVQDDPASLVEQLGAERIEERDEAQAKLKALGDKAVPVLEKAAFASNLETAVRAKHLLKVIPLMKELTENLRKALPGVEERLASGDKHLWTKVFLEATGRDEKIAPLYPSLEGKDVAPLTARAIDGALGELQIVAVLEKISAYSIRCVTRELAELLKHDNGAIRGYAVRALAATDGTESASEIFKLLKDTHPFVRLSAAEALGKFGDKKAAAAISEMLDEKDEDVRAAAAGDLGPGGLAPCLAERPKVVLA